jgi:N-glycosidase YbiA
LAAEIIEDSPVDYFWGCGIDRTGTNQLGRILMQVRTDLKRD